MKVVSENSEAELARREATLKMRWVLRELAANLMRITRGAGEPWEVGRQTQELVNTLVAHREACGHMPGSEEIAAALAIEERNWAQGVSDAASEMLDAGDTIVRGCLQIAASHLLGQNTQLAAARDEMHEGIRYLEEIREKYKGLPIRQRAQSQADIDLKKRIQEARASIKAQRRRKGAQP